MSNINKLVSIVFIAFVSSFAHAACTPAGSAGDDDIHCSGTLNSIFEVKALGGDDKVSLNSVSGRAAFWLDELLGGNPATDGDDIFIAEDSSFYWVLGFGGNDTFEVNGSNFSNLYADTNPGHGVSQRGNDTILVENSISNGWILGGNDNDSITIKDSRVSFVAAGYSDIYSDIPGYMDYTPYDGNDTIILDNVDFGEPNYYYTTRPGAVEGGKEDDLIVFRNGGSAYGVTGGHGNDQIIVEDDTLFNACTFINDRGNSVKCGIYGDEPYASEPNATTIARHGNDEIILYAGDISGITVDGGHGSDLVEISTSVLLLDANISGGDDRSIVDGFVDRLVFDDWNGVLNGAQLQNWEIIVFDNGSEISFLDDSLSTGFEAGEDAATNLPYGLVVQNAASWKIVQSFRLDGNLYNDAIVDLQADGNQADTVLNIANNYSGNGGEIRLDTVLNDASTSISDTLVIEGDTSGTTLVRINNVGGFGGLTPAGENEGILLVEVHGNSADDAFQLASTPVAGDYAYKLVKGSNGNWYLQSYKTSTPGSSSEEIIAEGASLVVYSYSRTHGQLPPPGTGTTCTGPFIYLLTEDVKHGDLVFDPSTGSYSYLPEADYSGLDTFRYRIRSEKCGILSNVATVTIRVECATSQSSDNGDALTWMGMFFFLAGMMLTAWYSLKPRY